MYECTKDDRLTAPLSRYYKYDINKKKKSIDQFARDCCQIYSIAAWMLVVNV